MGCWIKNGLADLSWKTLKSREVSLTYINDLCLLSHVSKIFHNKKSLKLFFCLEFQEIGEVIMWSCKRLFNQSVGTVAVGIREEKHINQMILCGKWGSKCLMVEELTLK